MTTVTQESNDIRAHLARSLPGSLVALLGNGEFCVGYTGDGFESMRDVMPSYLAEAMKSYFGKECHTKMATRDYGSKIILDYTLSSKGIPQLGSPQRKVVINVEGLSGTVRIEEGAR